MDTIKHVTAAIWSSITLGNITAYGLIASVMGIAKKIVPYLWSKIPAVQKLERDKSYWAKKIIDAEMHDATLRALIDELEQRTMALVLSWIESGMLKSMSDDSQRSVLQANLQYRSHDIQRVINDINEEAFREWRRKNKEEKK